MWRLAAVVAVAGCHPAPAPPVTNVAGEQPAPALPAGWSWRRTGEGDDLSGELDDDHGVARMTYQRFAHGVPVPDVCVPRPQLVSVRYETIRGAMVHACVLSNGHHCYGFPAVNLCTTDASFDADAFVRALPSLP